MNHVNSYVPIFVIMDNPLKKYNKNTAEWCFSLFSAKLDNFCNV